MAEAKQDTGPATAETEALDLGEFSALLERTSASARTTATS